MTIQRGGDGNALFPAGQYKKYEDTSFVTGDSPATLDFNADLGKNGNNGYIINDGAGDFTIAMSPDGTNFGEEITIVSGEIFDLQGRNINKLRVTWIADTAYRVFAE